MLWLSNFNVFYGFRHYLFEFPRKFLFSKKKQNLIHMEMLNYLIVLLQRATFLKIFVRKRIPPPCSSFQPY